MLLGRQLSNSASFYDRSPPLAIRLVADRGGSTLLFFGEGRKTMSMMQTNPWVDYLDDSYPDGLQIKGRINVNNIADFRLEKAECERPHRENYTLYVQFPSEKVLYFYGQIALDLYARLMEATTLPKLIFDSYPHNDTAIRDAINAAIEINYPESQKEWISGITDGRFGAAPVQPQSESPGKSVGEDDQSGT